MLYISTILELSFDDLSCEIHSQVMHDAFGVRLHAGRQAEVLWLLLWVYL